MFQEMINASIAVMSKPSVENFEEHEKDNLLWALIYSVLAAMVNALVAAIQVLLFPDMVGLSFGELSGVEGATVGAVGALFAFINAIIFTVMGLLIAWGITFGLGRAFGGTGTFGELAYGLSLFGAPLTIIGSVLNLIPFVGGIAGFILLIYNFYLTYLAIQSGMNLPSNKALYVILVQAVIGLAIVGCFVLMFVMLLGAAVAP